VNGRAFKPSDWTSHGTPIIRIQNLNGGGVFNYYLGDVDPRFRVETGNLLFSWSGTRGTSFGPHIWTGPEAILNQHIFNLRSLRDVEQGFLFHALKLLTAAIEKRAHGGTGIVHITKGELEGFLIAIPPLGEQRKIAAILSSVDEAIEATQAVIEQLQVVKKAMMVELLTRGLPGRHTRFKMTEIGEVPAEWEVVRIVSLAAPERHSFGIGPFGSDLLASDYRPEGVPVVFVRDVKPNAFKWKSNVFVSAEKATQLAAHRAIPGDIVITKMGFPAGIAALYPHGMEPGVITADIVRLRVDATRVDSTYLAYCLNGASASRQVDRITGGQTRPKISLRDFKTIAVALPPLQEQKELSSLLVTGDARDAQESQYVGGLRSVKAALMSVLLTGEVRVTPDAEVA
jgi:type I restriction enzyme, S subunit